MAGDPLQGGDVAGGQVLDVDVVAQGRAVRRGVVVADEPPRSLIGKVLRREVRDSLTG